MHRRWNSVPACATLAAFALVVAARAGEPAAAEPRAAPRNFVFISIDTLRADGLSCYGNERETSPNIDAFAARSLRYSNALAAANNTAPSHMSMFTGLYPPVHGQFCIDGRPGADPAANLELLPESIPLLAKRLSAAGFETLAYTDGGYITAQFKFDRGFDDFIRCPEAVGDKVDKVLERLANRSPERPLFLFFHTHAVHAPYAPPEEHDLWSDDAYAGPWRARVDEMRGHKHGSVGAEDFLPDRSGCTDQDSAYLRDVYDGCVHYTDAEIGRLLDALSQPPWADDTAILITSDHGEAFAEHGRHGHHLLYRAETEVPFVLHVPGVTAAVSDQPVSGVDVAPTVLDVLGLEPLPVADGVSVLGRIPPDRIRMSWYNDPSRGGGLMLLRGREKIMRLKPDGPWERYDLKADPFELNCLPTDDERAKRMQDAALERLNVLTQLAQSLRADVPTEVGSLSEETLASLRALGYLGEAEKQ